MLSGQEIARRTAVMAGALWDAECAGLGELVAHLGGLEALVDFYLPSAVDRARTAGAGWQEVARETGVSVATARGRWNRARLARMPVPDGDAAGTLVPTTAGPTEFAAGGGAIDPWGARRMAAALSFLQRTCGSSVVMLAGRSGLDEPVVESLLAGRRRPAWAEVGLLAAVMGGAPADLRQLWEWTVGREARPSAPAAACEKFRSALRGLHLAAGCPSKRVLAEQCGDAVNARAAEEIMRGEAAYPWSTVEKVVTAMGGDAARVWPLFLFCGGGTGRGGPAPANFVGPPGASGPTQRRP